VKVTASMLSLILTLTLCSCTTIKSVPNEENTNTPYKPELAHQLGADENEMRSYVFVTLLTGT